MDGAIPLRKFANVSFSENDDGTAFAKERLRRDRDRIQPIVSIPGRVHQVWVVDSLKDSKDKIMSFAKLEGLPHDALEIKPSLGSFKVNLMVTKRKAG